MVRQSLHIPPPFDGDRADTLSLLLANSANERLLCKQLSGRYRIGTDTGAFGGGEFDLLITDEQMFGKHLQRFRELKQQALPVLLPVLLLSGQRSAGVPEHLIEYADDILVMPTSPRVLQARIKLLLKARAYSQKLQVEKRKFQLLAENSTDMISIHNPQGAYTYASPSSKQILGYEPDELIGRNAYEFIDERDHKAVQLSREYTLETKEPCKVEFRKKTKGGGVRWVESILKALETPAESNVIQLQASTRDISDRKEYEKKLENEVSFIEASLDILPNIFFMVDSRLNFIRWNKNLVRTLGYPPEEIRRMSPFDFIREEDHDRVHEQIKEVFLSGEGEVEADLVSREGKAIRHKISGRKFIEGDEMYIIGTCVDISEQHNVVRELKASNEEKQVLLKEIHHRVKNNLAVISSMLQLQAMESDNAELTGSLKDSQLRIQSIASVHELLYQSESFARVDMQHYLDKLIGVIRQANRSWKDISVARQIDAVELNINQAIPCSLVANEIITNAFKHAFADRNEGEIYVGLSLNNKDEVCLTIRDNGTGLAEAVDFSDPRTLGLKLINVLKIQLEGRLEVRSAPGDGTSFELIFPRKESRGSAGNYIQ